MKKAPSGQSHGYCNTIVAATDCTPPPPDPEIVMSDVLLPPCFFVLMVSTEVPEVWIEGGANVAVVNFGIPSTERVTSPEKPEPPVTVTV